MWEIFTDILIGVPTFFVCFAVTFWIADKLSEVEKKNKKRS